MIDWHTKLLGMSHTPTEPVDLIRLETATAKHWIAGSSPVDS